MAEVNVVTQQKYEQQFTDIFLLLITVQCLVTLKFTSNVGQLLVDTLDFGLLAFACKRSRSLFGLLF